MRDWTEHCDSQPPRSLPPRVYVLCITLSHLIKVGLDDQ